MQGWMLKQGHVMKNWKRRFFQLKGSRLYYFQSEATTGPPCGTIDLRHYRAVTALDAPRCGQENGFLIVTDGGLYFLVYVLGTLPTSPSAADTPDTREEWMNAIRAAGKAEEPDEDPIGADQDYSMESDEEAEQPAPEIEESRPESPLPPTPPDSPDSPPQRPDSPPVVQKEPKQAPLTVQRLELIKASSAPVQSPKPDDVVISGWLTKQGHVVKSLKRRFCVLKGVWLHYYLSEKSEESSPKGSIDLHNLRTVETIDRGPGFGFLLLTSTGKSFLLFAESERERQRWMYCAKTAGERRVRSMSQVSMAPPDPEDLLSESAGAYDKSERGVKTGWLVKQGGNWKSWKRRYFVLQGSSLFYFKRPEDTTPAGSISVKRYRNMGAMSKDRAGKSHSFQVTEAAGRMLVMAAETDNERDDWLGAFRNADAEDSDDEGGSGAMTYDPGARISEAGFLSKEGHVRRSWKRRWFILQGTKLHYFKTQTAPEPAGTIDLKGFTAVAQLDRKAMSRHDFPFHIVTASGVAFMMAADTAELRDRWITSVLGSDGDAPGAAAGGSGGAAESKPARELTEEELSAKEATRMAEQERAKTEARRAKLAAERRRLEEERLLAQEEMEMEKEMRQLEETKRLAAAVKIKRAEEERKRQEEEEKIRAQSERWQREKEDRIRMHAELLVVANNELGLNMPQSAQLEELEQAIEAHKRKKKEAEDHRLELLAEANNDFGLGMPVSSPAEILEEALTIERSARLLEAAEKRRHEEEQKRTREHDAARKREELERRRREQVDGARLVAERKRQEEVSRILQEAESLKMNVFQRKKAEAERRRKEKEEYEQRLKDFEEKVKREAEAMERNEREEKERQAREFQQSQEREQAAKKRKAELEAERERLRRLALQRVEGAAKHVERNDDDHDSVGAQVAELEDGEDEWAVAAKKVAQKESRKQQPVEEDEWAVAAKNVAKKQQPVEEDEWAVAAKKVAKKESRKQQPVEEDEWAVASRRVAQKQQPVEEDEWAVAAKKVAQKESRKQQLVEEDEWAVAAKNLAKKQQPVEEDEWAVAAKKVAQKESRKQQPVEEDEWAVAAKNLAKKQQPVEEDEWAVAAKKVAKKESRKQQPVEEDEWAVAAKNVAQKESKAKAPAGGSKPIPHDTMMAMMKQGSPLIKLQAYGKPKTMLVFLSDKEDAVIWCEVKKRPAASQEDKHRDKIMLRDVTAIKVGRETAIMQKNKAEPGDEQKSFSIVAGKTTLDLVAYTPRQAMVWQNALSDLCPDAGL